MLKGLLVKQSYDKAPVTLCQFLVLGVRGKNNPEIPVEIFESRRCILYPQARFCSYLHVPWRVPTVLKYSTYYWLCLTIGQLCPKYGLCLTIDSTVSQVWVMSYYWFTVSLVWVMSYYWPTCPKYGLCLTIGYTVS